VIDVGTGSGGPLLRRARIEPDAYFIGLDADSSSLREASFRAARPKSRGGLTNATFIAAGVALLPGPLADLADQVTVILPWGSLLSGLLTAEPKLVAGGLRALLKPAGRLDLLLSVVESDVGAGGRRLDEAGAHALGATFKPLGLTPTEVRLADELDLNRLGSSWGRRLGIPRRRQAWILSFRRS